MSEKAVARTMTRTNFVLAIDMTALWNRQTTGIQRVIRQMTPYLAAAAAKRGWDVVLVRHTNQGLVENDGNIRQLIANFVRQRWRLQKRRLQTLRARKRKSKMPFARARTLRVDGR